MITGKAMNENADALIRMHSKGMLPSMSLLLTVITLTGLLMFFLCYPLVSQVIWK
jgi:hypothetical protein